MRVHVGPLPSAGVAAWIVYARDVVAERSGPDADPATRLEPEVIEGFAHFLDEWEAVTEASDTFLWETDVDPEQVEFLAFALYKVAVSLDSDRPPAGEPFYRAFVTAFLDAMSTENPVLASYAEELRESWPDLAD